MGIRNYLIEGVSGTGKTAVCDELLRRGIHAIHGDRELAYSGDPQTGQPTNCTGHQFHVWNIEKVRAVAADQTHVATYFCGGSRNREQFIDLFDQVFVLHVDAETLIRRLVRRSEDEWGGLQSQRDQILKLHSTREDLPKNATVVDATISVACVVDQIIEVAEPFAET